MSGGGEGGGGGATRSPTRPHVPGDDGDLHEGVRVLEEPPDDGVGGRAGPLRNSDKRKYTRPQPVDRKAIGCTLQRFQKKPKLEN